MAQIFVDTGKLQTEMYRLQRLKREAESRADDVEAIQQGLDMQIRAREHFDRRLAGASCAIIVQAQRAGACARFLSFAASKYETADDAARAKAGRLRQSLGARLASGVAAFRRKAADALGQLKAYVQARPATAALLGLGVPGVALLWGLSQQSAALPSAIPPPTGLQRPGGPSSSGPSSQAPSSAAPTPTKPEYEYTPPNLGSESYVHKDLGGVNPNPYRKECCWYVWGRVHEKSGGEIHFSLAGDYAKEWWSFAPQEARLTDPTRVEPGMIGCFSEYGSDSRGHVVYVEDVYVQGGETMVRFTDSYQRLADQEIGAEKTVPLADWLKAPGFQGFLRPEKLARQPGR